MTKTSWFRNASRHLRKSAARPALSRRPLVEWLEGRSLLSTITVTLATDPATTHTGTSLRDAITQVDAGKYTTIAFNVPGTAAGNKTIAVSSSLPAITKPVTIDGTTEPGYAGKPVVAITRANSTVAGYGLLVTGGGTTVKGLAVYGFGGYGLRFDNGGGNTVVDDYIGVNTTGTLAPGNGAGGIWLNDSSGNTIGGTSADSRNIISGNGGDGVVDYSGSVGNTIVGNSIGTDVTGSLKLANLGNGITIEGIGSATPTTIIDNTIANSGYYGISLGDTINFPTTTDVVIQGNSVSNSEHRGIAVIHASAVTIGGTASSAANTVTANGLRDGDFDSYAAGVAVVNGSSNVSVIGDTIGGNGRGVRVSGSASVTVSNNTITGNATQGVYVDDDFGGPSQYVQLTGDTITGNGGSGIRVDSSSNIVLTNDKASSNSGDGVYITTGCSGVTLTSDTVQANVGYGVEVLSTLVSLPGVTTNTITGNTKGNVSRN